MQFRTSLLSLLPSQFRGLKLIRYVLGPIGVADTFCSAVLMRLNMSILPLTVSFTSILSCMTCQFLSQLLLKCCQICCGDRVCSQFCCCWSCCWSCCCCCRGLVLLSSVSTRGVPQRRSATVTSATLFHGATSANANALVLL